MVTRPEFWRIIAAYGAQIWPAQVIFYLAAILVVGWLLLKPGRLGSLLAKVYLAVAFAWIGVLFYMLLARDMAGGGRGNYFFGSIFLLISLLFVVDVFRGRMQFCLPGTGWRRYSTLALLLLVFCYPWFGLASGHGLHSLIVPGVFPCPTIALALTLLTIALPQVDKIIYILLLFLAIPFTPFYQIARYGVYEDTILFVTGLYSLVLLWRSWKPDSASS